MYEINGKQVKLTKAEAAVYYEIARCVKASRMNGKRDQSGEAFAYPHIATIANKCSVSEITVKRAVKSLRDKGIIRTERGVCHGASHYFLCGTLRKADTASARKMIPHDTAMIPLLNDYNDNNDTISVTNTKKESISISIKSKSKEALIDGCRENLLKVWRTDTANRKNMVEVLARVSTQRTVCGLPTAEYMDKVNAIPDDEHLDRCLERVASADGVRNKTAYLLKSLLTLANNPEPLHERKQDDKPLPVNYWKDVTTMPEKTPTPIPDHVQRKAAAFMAAHGYSERSKAEIAESYRYDDIMADNHNTTADDHTPDYRMTFSDYNHEAFMRMTIRERADYVKQRLNPTKEREIIYPGEAGYQETPMPF